MYKSIFDGVYDNSSSRINEQGGNLINRAVANFVDYLLGDGKDNLKDSALKDLKTIKSVRLYSDSRKKVIEDPANYLKIKKRLERDIYDSINKNL